MKDRHSQRRQGAGGEQAGDGPTAPRATLGRWLLASAALAFLLIPGHRNLPLAGIPICDLWFFVAWVGWAFVFIALPWRPTRARDVWPALAALIVLCALKPLPAILDGGHGLQGTYTAIVRPPPAKAQYFGKPDAAGLARVSEQRFDRDLDFTDNTFRPFRQSFRLTMLNARPLYYLTPSDAAATGLHVVWTGFVRVERPGEYVFGADVVHRDDPDHPMPQRDSYRIQVGEHVFAGRGATRPDERAAGLAAGVYPIRIEYDRAAAKPQVSQAGERLEKREPGMRFQLRWRRGSGGERPVPWWALGRTEADAAAGWAWGAVGIGLLAAAGAVGAWIAVRRAAWDRLFSRRQRVRGLVFALMLVQLGASTAMTIRQTTSRRQWNVLNAYDDKTYERRAQTMLRCGWISREARQEGAIERSSLMEYYLPGLHLLFGGDYGLMAMAQNVLVCLTVLPAFGLGRLIFRRQAVALLGAALVAVDPTFTEYGRLLLPTAASLFLFIAAVWLLFGGRRSGRWGRFVAGGLVFGLAIMGRTNLVGAVPGALLLILWPGRAALPRRLGQVAVVLAAMVVAWLPVPVRQMQLAGRWMWAPTQGPMILVVFNAPPDPAGHEAYRQDFLRFAERAAPDAETRELLDKFADNAFVRHEGPRAHLIGEPVTPRELLIVNPYLTRFLFEEVAQRPGRFAATVGRKLADFWWTGNAGSHFRPHAILLALALLTSLRRRGRGRAAAVYVMIAGIVAVLVLSWFVERHRSVIVPLIDVMFAGSAVWWVRRLWADLRARLGGNELGSPPAGP